MVDKFDALIPRDMGFWVHFALYAGITIAVVYVFFLVAVNLWGKSYANAKKPQADTDEVPADVRGKVQRVLFGAEAGDTESTVAAVADLINEEAVHLTETIRKEFGEKYKALVMEKNVEIDSVQKVYKEVKQKFAETEKTLKKVDIEKKQTEAVVRSIAEGLVVVNQKGEVLLMNPSAEKILGVRQEKKMGKSLMDDLPDEMMVSMSRDANADSDEKIIEYTSKNENVKKVLRSSSAVIQNEDGQTVGMVNILTDVTKQRELDEMKNKFVSNVTHELRTPIVAMQNAVAILVKESTSMTDVQKKFLDIVSRSSVQLKSLVEDVLDISKTDSGKMMIRPKPGKLDKALHEVCDLLETWAKSKDIKVVREIDKNIPELSFDPDKITQVMNNYLSNAIKFTPQSGKITVQCRQPDPKTVKVSVTDTGCGIAAADVPKLFNRFAQFGDHQGITGTGLGLAIVKDLVERHGGQVSAESEEKKGSTFSFTLPVPDK